MAPAFTETAFVEEVKQPQRPPEPLSSASELATARAYDHFHPCIPRSASAASSDSDRPAMLEGYAPPPLHGNSGHATEHGRTLLASVVLMISLCL